MILEPAAVLDIVGFMFWDYSRTWRFSISALFSPDESAPKLFGDNITIWDDVAHPLQSRLSV